MKPFQSELYFGPGYKASLDSPPVPYNVVGATYNYVASLSLVDPSCSISKWVGLYVGPPAYEGGAPGAVVDGCGVQVVNLDDAAHTLVAANAAALSIGGRANYGRILFPDTSIYETGQYPSWQPSHPYVLGNEIMDNAGHIQQVTAVTGSGMSGVTIPAFNSAGGSIGDNEVMWTALVWQALISYALGSQIIDVAGHTQQVTTAGTSGMTVPSFNDGGGTTADGSVVWTDEGVSPLISGVLELSATSAVQTAQGVGFRVGGLNAGAGLEAGSIRINKTDLSGTELVGINSDGADVGNITTLGSIAAAGSISAGTGAGFQIGGSAVTGNYLRGNSGGTDYVASAIQAGDLPVASATVSGAVNTSAQSFAGTKTFTGAVGVDEDLGVSGNLYVVGSVGVSVTPGYVAAASFSVITGGSVVAGASGSFTAGGTTVTVTNGIITSIS